MGKGGYNGGSSTVGFRGSFTGVRSSKLMLATDVDAHLKKRVRNEATKKSVRRKRAAKKKLG